MAVSLAMPDPNLFDPAWELDAPDRRAQDAEIDQRGTSTT
jgi:hypothetical protein